MVDIVFATHNAHKRLEVQAIMRSVWPEITLLEPAGEPPVEDGQSFTDNALIKARSGFADSGMLTLADDSGICVDALGGAPGIHSARYSGTGDDRKNVEFLLSNLDGVIERSAHFVCAAAVVGPELEHTIERAWSGRVTESPAGEGGFGYDPVFVPEGLNVTAAELGPEEKNELSHRAQAFRAMAEFLRDYLG